MLRVTFRCPSTRKIIGRHVYSTRKGFERTKRKMVACKRCEKIHLIANADADVKSRQSEQ
jgi:hypothetical protein